MSIPGIDTLSAQPAWLLPFPPGLAGIIAIPSLPVSSGDTSKFFQWLCLVFFTPPSSVLWDTVSPSSSSLTSEREKEEAHTNSNSLLLPKCLCQPAPHGPRAPCKVCGRGNHLLTCAASVSPTTMVLCGSRPSNGTMECWEQKLHGDGGTGHPSQTALVPYWFEKDSMDPGATEVDRKEVYQARDVESSVVNLCVIAFKRPS